MTRNGLKWYASGENSDYIAPRIMAVGEPEWRAMLDASKTLYQMQWETAQWVAQQGLWRETGIPEAAISLVEYSLREEAHLHLVGRYDFAGGIGETPLKLLEFNADTWSLLPETTLVQPEMIRQLNPTRQPAAQHTFDMLTDTFRDLLRRYPDREKSLLLSGMGYEEDTLNLDVVGQAARKAGFEWVQQVDLQRVVFSEDDGIFVELGPERYRRCDFWFKMVPWDFICYDEPDLLDLLEPIIKKQLCIVVNPAHTFLLQSKGLLPYMSERYPDHPLLLPASFDQRAFHGHTEYIAKPVFGRMGENIRMYDASGKVVLENEGDYGDFPYIYQQITPLDEDNRGFRYQPSVYWMQKPASLCFRRQDDLAIDDDAQFVSTVVEN